MTRRRVAVIGGGASCEHDVSLASAASVADALDPAAYQVVRLTIDRHGGWRAGERTLGLAAAVRLLQGCDVVVPVVHGPHGEDGTLAALCDLAGVPYVGSGVHAGALAMDKWVTKLVAADLGIAVAPGRLATASTKDGLTWDRPVVVKPVGAGSSLGVSLVRDPSGFEAALDMALAYDDRILVEDLVDGREIDVAVLRRSDGDLVASPPLEIVADGIFDYGAKYGGEADFRVPADLTVAAHKQLCDAALAVFEGLGCAGLARVDFFLTADGPVLNEVNTMPGMTAHSQAPRMFAAAGMPYPALLDELVRGAD